MGTCPAGVGTVAVAESLGGLAAALASVKPTLEAPLGRGVASRGGRLKGAVLAASEAERGRLICHLLPHWCVDLLLVDDQSGANAGVV